MRHCLLAGKGSGAFYAGELAKDIVRAVREAPVNPGRMTAEDLAGYDAPLRAPTKAHYRGFTLYGMGPPSSGGVTTLQILQLLQAAPPPREVANGRGTGTRARESRAICAECG